MAGRDRNGGSRWITVRNRDAMEDRDAMEERPQQLRLQQLRLRQQWPQQQAAATVAAT